MEIQFENGFQCNGEDDTVTFQAKVDGRRVVCEVEPEALEFRSPLNIGYFDDEERMRKWEAVEMRMSLIQQIARALLERGADCNGRLVIDAAAANSVL